MAEMSLAQGLDVLNRRTRNVRGLIIIFIVTSVMTIVAGFAELSGIVDLKSAELDTPSLLATLVYAIYVIAFIVTIILVARWIYRAHANLSAAHLQGLEFTPGWAVGGYFVPFANLFKPYQAMRELWNNSYGQGDSYTAEAPGNLKAWWACWLAGNILSNVSTRLTLAGETTEVSFAIDAISTALLVCAAWLLLQIVKAVNSAQHSMMGLSETFA